MPGVTKEQIQAAREADLFTYLQFHEPGVLKRDGPNFRHKEHDSLVYVTGKRYWYWNSRGRSINALDYLIQIRGYGLVDAVHALVMAVNEPYALMVQPDDILISPREVDEHFGTMVCFHPRYALGDHHNHMDKDDFLREMYLDTVGHDEAGMKRYERMVNIVSSRFRHGPKTEERAIDEAMQKVISEKYLMLPLYLYDHSGLAMSTESFSGRAPHAEWDSGQVGWIYVSKEDALKEFDADKMTGAIRQKADALMRSEVAAYDSYLRGECYGFELYKNGELSDSCWGFMGNFSDVLKDMAAYLPDECKGMVDHLEEQERPATIIKTLLKHAKIQVDQAAKAFEHASRQQVLGESR